jgi:predicted PurR-regulated permease PerM
MINYNKLYSGLFSILVIYVVMTTFELVFFIFIVRPVITTSIHKLLLSYQNENDNSNNQYNLLDPNPMLIIDVLNEREYELIDQLNFNSYLVIIIVILLLTSLLFFLYVKIGIIEQVENTEASESNNDRMDNNTGSEIIEFNIEFSSRSIRSSQTSNITNIRNVHSIRQIYLKHAIKCALSTITCLIIYQIFFYNYGLTFKYVGSSEELIVLFIRSILLNG